MPATHSFPWSCLRPSATASKSVAAVTSTVWATPSMSAIVTRQDRISIARKYHIRFLFAIWFWLAFSSENQGERPSASLIVRRNAKLDSPCDCFRSCAFFRIGTSLLPLLRQTIRGGSFKQERERR